MAYNDYSRILSGVLALLTPILLFIATAIVSGIYPFGEQSFLTEDLKYQYIDFFTWYKGVLEGNGTLFYSTSQALGMNTWGLFSYYLVSPFNLLLIFFDESHITLCVWFITLIKIGCIGFTTWFYLLRRFKLDYVWTVVLAVGFAWSSWTVTQLRNPMWLDGIILLPLMALGMYAFVRNGSWKLLIASISIAIITNWYIAYTIILFSVMLFVLEMYLFIANGSSSAHGSQRVRHNTLRFVVRKTALLVLIYLGSLGISACVFLPTILAMSGDMSTVLFYDSDNGDIFRSKFKQALILGCLFIVVVVLITAFFIVSKKKLSRKTFRKTITAVLSIILLGLVLVGLTNKFPMATQLNDLIAGFFGGTYVLDSTPQLFGGTILLVGVLAFFCTRSIAWDRKVLFGIVLFLLIMSCWFNYLYYVWCGFKGPNGFYCRMSFLVVFMMIVMSAYLLEHKEQLSKKCVLTSCIAVSMLYIVLFLIQMTPITSVLLAFLIILIFIFILKLESGKKATSVLLKTLLVLAVFTELLLSSCIAWRQIYVGYSQQQHDAYVEGARSEIASIAYSDESFYRIAKTYTRANVAALNEGMALGYNEISSYSSAHDGDAIRVLNALGYSKEGEFSTRYAEPQLVLDSLFSVRYVISTQQPAGFIDTDIKTSIEGMRVWKNPYALSLGYEVSNKSLDLTLQGIENPFIRQNAVLSAFLGKEVSIYSACEFTRDNTDSHSEATTYELLIPAHSIGYYYAKSNSQMNPAIYISVDGDAPVVENERFSQSLHVIANPSESEQAVIIQVSGSDSMDAPEPNTNDSLFYALNMTEFIEAIDQLAENQFVASSWSGNGISGTCVMRDYGIMMLEIPWDSGWIVRVDGSEVETIPLLDKSLTGIALEPGDHTIEMEFKTPGLMVGIFLTIMSLIIVGIIGIRQRVRNRDHKPIA